MDGAIRTGLDAPKEGFCPGLQNGPTPLFDLLRPVGQLGEEVPSFCWTMSFEPKHRFAVISSRAQSQIASSALKSGLYPAGSPIAGASRG